MRLRSKARETALHVLYRAELTKEDIIKAYEAHLEYNSCEPEVVDFSRKIIDQLIANTCRVDEIITKYVKNWGIDRMAVIDRNILRVACVELLYIDDVPPKVTINEAIELAKRFGDMDSPRFVNGILDKIYKMENAKKDGVTNSPDV